MSDNSIAIQNAQGDVIGVGVHGNDNKIAKTINVYQFSLLGQLGDRTGWIKDYATSLMGYLGGQFLAKKMDVSSIREIGVLREHLNTIKVLDRPTAVSLKGTLCPAQLLFNGWWERKDKKEKQTIQWKDGVQEWLFKGFELWGPSWDVTRPTPENPNPYLVAQLGDGDEAESLPVLIPPEMAAQVREDYLVGKGGRKLWVYEANVSGILCHRSHLNQPGLFSGEKLSQSDLTQLQQWDQQWGEAFDYCILLSESVKSHSAAPHQKKKIDLYSGYIWKCVMPKAWVQEGKVPSVNEVFFLWEHTDFTKSDAVLYNMDSLDKKVAYLEKKYGELVLLQKSSDLIDGEPRFSTDEFYNKIFKST